MIRSITDADDGVYKCNASNSQGWTSATVRVKVDVTEAPQIAVAPTAPTTVNYGAEIFLQCAATGIPTPQITWLRNSQELKFDDNHRSIDIYNVTQRLNGRPVDVISNLMIRNITDADDGVYECNVSNSQGWTSATVRVKVDVTADRHV
ncbi:probable oxidoreductase PXDNL [Corticium candelabrum]|uniref:probable oxidoreductase PXDNL n=1 Tax=Corticium candelabrum TaxID=121492 RepID=UPI002E254598|nr:probable oxidoreductase PXDNL [Corticium candelabrum]